MSDYRYGDVISMQEAAIRRVNEMQRRAREAARLANEELSGGTAKNFQQSGEGRDSRSAFAPQKTVGHTNLPVDYLHGGYPEGYSGGHYPQNSQSRSENEAYYNNNEKKDEVFHSVPTDSGKNHPDTPKNQNSQQKVSNRRNAESERNNKSSSSGNQRANQNSWAQAAVNRQQKQTIQSPPHRESSLPQRQMPHNVQRNNQPPFSFGENGIFSALGSIAGKMDNDTMLLLGLMYILWRDGADYGLLFALFYILM